jgi:adenosylcobinamide kinase / adenosylcobinamide-phosphate guanylyltransferase
MNEIILVTGGRRSGKSGYAQRLAEKNPGLLTYLATAPHTATDEEMHQRILRHQADRDPARWVTRETQTNLAPDLRACAAAPVVLVDCLTLWISNLLGHGETPALIQTEDQMAALAREVIAAARTCCGRVIFVTNEVGWGLVPMHPLARLFSDLSGRCNQVMAEGADHVFLMSCGLPLKLKGGVELDHGIVN